MHTRCKCYQRCRVISSPSPEPLSFDSPVLQNYGNLAASLQRSFGMEPTAEALAIAEAQRQQLEGQGQEGQQQGGEAEARSGEVGTSQRVQVGGDRWGVKGAAGLPEGRGETARGGSTAGLPVRSGRDSTGRGGVRALPPPPWPAWGTPNMAARRSCDRLGSPGDGVPPWDGQTREATAVRPALAQSGPQLGQLKRLL